MENKYTHLRIELSKHCNLHCSYCRTLEGVRYASRGEIPIAKIKEIINDAERLGIETIVLTGGGEPFMRRDIFEILRYTDLQKIIITNGTLLTESTVKELSTIPQLAYLKISFEGEKAQEDIRGKYALERVKEAIKLLDKYDIPYAFNSVLTTDVVDDFYNLWRFVASTRAFSWGVYPLINHGKAADGHVKAFEPEKIVKAVVPVIKEYIEYGAPLDLEIENLFVSKLLNNDLSFISTEKDHPCAYQLSAATIRLNGELAQCARYESTFGSIYDNTLEELLNVKERRDFLNISISQMPRCKICKYMPLCSGGCIGRKVIAKQSVSEPDVIACGLMEAFEKYIVPILPPKQQKFINDIINKQ